MKYNLFLDDVRFPSHAWIYDQNKKLSEVSGIEDTNWVIVRSFNEFVTKLVFLGLPDVVSFDHDLCDEHVEHFLKEAIHTRVFDYSKSKVETGLDCAKYLIEFAKHYKLEIPTFFVHSANDVGRENIRNLINSAKQP